MPKEVYHAYGYVKKAAALVNTRAGRLPEWKGQLIERVCDEVISGALDDNFPLYVWQTGSGPRTGIHELLLPANEPGSSIMPGKVNPTQAEAMLMVSIQIISSDVAVTMGGAEGNFELNAFRPILINNYLHSALIMADMCDHFREFMIEGAQLNAPKLKENIERSVMMVTALSPIIGYDQASVISHYAIDHDLTLKQAALANGVSEELFDRVVNPLALTRGGSADLPSGPKEGPK